MSSAVVRRAAAASARCFSTAAPAVNVDWALVRSRMMTEEAKAQADRAKETFQKRISAAEGVRDLADIDWAYYKAKLPMLDVDAIRADYEKVQAATPAIAYDEAADRTAHEAKEAAWRNFATFCATRIKELQQLQEEQSKHKLHDRYRRRQLYSRFPGLYESIHAKVRGSWDNEVWGEYLAYKGGLVALPWDPNHGEVDESKKAEIIRTIAERSGLKPEDLGAKA